MDPQLRTFTVEEAQALIPNLTALLIQLKEKQKKAMGLETQIDALELIADRESERSVQELNQLIEKHHAEATEFYAIVDKIHGHGCVLKDAQTGLIDFYAVINGKVVYLCWKLGEKAIDHWHDVGKGFSSREPLANLLHGED